MVGSIGGIVSGMDTHSIISQLMQLERVPQLRLQSQRAGIEKVIAAFRSLNTKITGLGDAAQAMTGLNGWSLAKATSSDATRVAVSATAGATPASLTFAVKSLATAASAISSGSVSSTDAVITGGSFLMTKGLAPLGFGTATPGAALAPGEHTLTVTQASTAATRTGGTALAASTTITNGQNDLTLDVNGAARTITLAAGTYDPTQLAAEVQRHLGPDVTASVGADGRLALTTAREGSTASIQITGGKALNALGLTADATAVGVDAVIELDGQPTTLSTVGDRMTITNATGDSVVATVAGGLRVGQATVQMVEVAGQGTLQEVVDGINAAGSGVTAAAIQTSPGVYRLQVTSKTTGAGSTFSFDGGTFPSSLSTLGTMQQLAQGTDAVLTVGTGPGAYDITRTTNSITDLFKGVTLTLAKADPATPVTIEVGRDTEGLAAQAKKLVDALNTALGEISNLTKYDAESKKAGLLVGDGMLRRIRSSLLGTVTGAVSVTSAVDGSRLTAGSVGIELQRDGTVKLDQAKFLEAYAKDPSAVEALLGKGTDATPGLAGRVEAEVKRVTDRVDGLIPGAIKSKESQIRGFTQRISSWDNRLELRELTLRRQFTAMEKALGAAQQQGQWLAGQIAGLPSWRD